LIDGQDIQGTIGIKLEDVYSCHLRNLTIKNCEVGIKLTALSQFSECNRIEHVRMIDVKKGIVFEKGTGTGSFAFTNINDVGISLKQFTSSVGIEIGSGASNCGCQPYNSFIRANVWMGPTNPGTGLKIENGIFPGEIKGGLGILSVHNSGSTATAIGINLDNSNNAIKGNQAAFLLAYHNLQASDPDRRVYNPGIGNEYRTVEF
jgi:hypothetical protein